MLDLRPRRLDLTGVRKSLLQRLVYNTDLGRATSVHRALRTAATFIDCLRELLLVILDPHGSKKKH